MKNLPRKFGVIVLSIAIAFPIGSLADPIILDNIVCTRGDIDSDGNRDCDNPKVLEVKVSMMSYEQVGKMFTDLINMVEAQGRRISNLEQVVNVQRAEINQLLDGKNAKFIELQVQVSEAKSQSSSLREDLIKHYHLYNDTRVTDSVRYPP